jgi:hypothetical protein
VLPHPGVNKDSGPETRNQRLPRADVHGDHIVRAEQLVQALEAISHRRAHSVEMSVAIEDGISEGHPAPGGRGLRFVVYHDAVPPSEQAMGYGRPDVADATNQHCQTCVRLHGSIVPCRAIAMGGGPQTRAICHAWQIGASDGQASEL